MASKPRILSNTVTTRLQWRSGRASRRMRAGYTRK